MDSLTDLINGFDQYRPALIALTVLCLAVLVQSFLAGILGFKDGVEVPGIPLKGNHQDFTFRALRTYGNSVENLPAFAIVVVLAVIVGASPGLVNWLAGIHVAIRLAYWGIYYSGIGKVAGGPRTGVYVLGWLVNLVLAVVVLISFF